MCKFITSLTRLCFYLLYIAEYEHHTVSKGSVWNILWRWLIYYLRSISTRTILWDRYSCKSLVLFIFIQVITPIDSELRRNILKYIQLNKTKCIQIVCSNLAERIVIVGYVAKCFVHILIQNGMSLLFSSRRDIIIIWNL